MNRANPTAPSSLGTILASIALIGILNIAPVALSAELTWTQKTDMPTPRWGNASAVVKGKIYVIGGAPSEPVSSYLPTVQEYDPATDTWTAKADMPTARFGLSTCVVNAKIYAIGGDDLHSTGSPAVEEYDPTTDAWTQKADMPTGRDYLATVAVDGKIYAIGGTVSYSDGFPTVEEYDPATDTWTRKADMPMRLWGLCAHVVRGKIYTVGGRPGLAAVPRVQEYDPATDTWTRKVDMPVGTSQMDSVVLDDKIVVIAGWRSSMNLPYTTVQIYDPETDIWTIEGDAPFLRAAFSAEVVNNRIYVIGGTDTRHPCSATSTVYELTVGFPPDFNGDYKIDIEDLIMLIDHWGQNEPSVDIAPVPSGDGVVDTQDLELFMSYWGQELDDQTLVAHWALDETEGTIAHDSVGTYDSVLLGDPVWEPDGGQIGGALEFDGVDDCIVVSGGIIVGDCVLNPADGPFSVLAWVKGGTPGQVLISQADGENWLMADALEGTLATGLIPPASRTHIPPLVSDMVITDDNWHRIGVVWDGTSRALYVDDVLVAEDMQNALASCWGDLNIGCGADQSSGTFFSGLVDDVRIYKRAVRP
jgi:N-acetylneuraminic acid mutarotase